MALSMRFGDREIPMKKLRSRLPRVRIYLECRVQAVRAYNRAEAAVLESKH
jgi:hypothetical protein